MIKLLAMMAGQGGQSLVLRLLPPVEEVRTATGLLLSRWTWLMTPRGDKAGGASGGGHREGGGAPPQQQGHHCQLGLCPSSKRHAVLQSGLMFILQAVPLLPLMGLPGRSVARPMLPLPMMGHSGSLDTCLVRRLHTRAQYQVKLKPSKGLPGLPAPSLVIVNVARAMVRLWLLLPYMGHPGSLLACLVLTAKTRARPQVKLKPKEGRPGLL